jgi:hypothetical protein
MAASSQSVASFGRIAVYGNVTAVVVIVTATATVYSSAGGGLPIDLTTVLQQAAPFSMDNLHPKDIVAVIPMGLSTNGFIPGGFALGTPTYTNKAGVSTQGGNASVLATCPATIRLNGIGASNANHAGLGEVADGAVTDAVTLLLVIARGGENA